MINYIKELLFYLFSNSNSNENNSITFEEAIFISNINTSYTNNSNKKTNKEIEMIIFERQK